MKLYEYGEEMSRLVAWATEEGEITDEILEELQGLGDNFKEKVVSCVKVIKDMNASIETLDVELRRLLSRKSGLKKKAAWLKDYVLHSMGDMEMDVVKDDLLTIRVSDTPGRVNIVDQTMIPTRYLEHGEVRVQKAEILIALKEGEVVPGCELEKGKSLRIR